MAWESRSGKGSYYTRSTRRNGRVTRMYFGKGELAGAIAWFDAHDREEDRQERDDAHQKQAEWQRTDTPLIAFYQAVETISRQTLEAAGYHRQNRGKWRKKRMTTAQDETQIQPRDQAVSVQEEVSVQEAHDAGLIKRARKGEKIARTEIRQALSRMSKPPESNMCHQAKELMLMALSHPKTDLEKECIRREIDAVRQQVAGPIPTPLEALLADRVALCWASMQDADRILNAASVTDLTAAQILPYHKRAEIAQKRYLSAIKTLAQVQRLRVPAMQINFADKQINVVGTCE